MVERRSRATTGTTQKENGARSDGAKRRSVGRQIMARTGEPRRSKRAQRDAKPGAKRRSEPGWARVFLLLMSCGYCKSPQKHYRHKASLSVGLRAVAIAPTLRARILGGSLPVVSSLRDSTTGYCLSPLTGLKFRLADARKLIANFRFIVLVLNYQKPPSSIGGGSFPRPEQPYGVRAPSAQQFFVYRHRGQ